MSLYTVTDLKLIKMSLLLQEYRAAERPDGVAAILDVARIIEVPQSAIDAEAKRDARVIPYEEPMQSRRSMALPTPPRSIFDAPNGARIEPITSESEGK
jgi:hypothetical protein